MPRKKCQRLFVSATTGSLDFGTFRSLSRSPLFPSDIDEMGKELRMVALYSENLNCNFQKWNSCASDTNVFQWQHPYAGHSFSSQHWSLWLTAETVISGVRRVIHQGNGEPEIRYATGDFRMYYFVHVHFIFKSHPHTPMQWKWRRTERWVLASAHNYWEMLWSI